MTPSIPGGSTSRLSETPLLSQEQRCQGAVRLCRELGSSDSKPDISGRTPRGVPKSIVEDQPLTTEASGHPSGFDSSFPLNLNHNPKLDLSLNAAPLRGYPRLTAPIRGKTRLIAPKPHEKFSRGFPRLIRGCRPVARVALSCTKKIIYFSPEPRHPRLTLSNGKSRLLTPINVQNFRVPNTCSRSLSALGRGYGVRCLRDMTESCGCVGGKVHPGVR